jgi:5-methylcytosine-specific restriction endonuclease McrA
MVTKTLNRIKRMFPQLKATRLRQVTDFYTLAVLVGKFEHDGLIMTDRRRNRLAWDLLLAFTRQVDEVRELQRKIRDTRPDQELYREYLSTVLQTTDEVSQRRKRQQILGSILQSLFARRDNQRGFSSEQRRIMWNMSGVRKCAHPGCAVKLTWDDFTIDHIHPHSKGGQTQLDNAALMCRTHNSAKGNKRR